MIYLYAYLANVLVALLVYARAPRLRPWRHVPDCSCSLKNCYRGPVVVLSILAWPVAMVVLAVVALWKPYPEPDTGADDKDPDSGGAYR